VPTVCKRARHETLTTGQITDAQGIHITREFMEHLQCTILHNRARPQNGAYQSATSSYCATMKPSSFCLIVLGHRKLIQSFFFALNLRHAHV
jgi:hypothetical protein